MTFISGPMTNSNPGAALFALMEPVMQSLGWVTDDTHVIGGNTHKLMKSPAAGNSLGKDFWLDIQYPTVGTTGGMRILPIEVWDATANLAYRPCTNQSNTTMDATTYSRHGATGVALEGSFISSTPVIALVATATTYAFSITRDRIIAVIGSETRVVIGGLFTPTADHVSYVGADLFPSIAAAMAGDPFIAEGANSATTRMPRWTNAGGAVFNWNDALQVHSSNDFNNGLVGGTVSPFTGKRTLSNLIVGYNTQPTGSGIAFMFVGYLPDIAICRSISSALRGDTLTIGSETWYCGYVSGRMSVWIRQI